MESLTSKEFEAVFAEGKKRGNRFFRVVVREGDAKLGMVVSGKVGKAVTRNALRRLIREVVRKEGLRGETIVIATPHAVELLQGRRLTNVQRELAPLLKVARPLGPQR